MRTMVIAATLAALAVAATQVRAQDQEPRPAAPAEAPRPTFPQDSPEAAFRSLIAAMALGNETAVRRLALPDDDLAVLLRGDRVKPEQAEFLREAVDKIKLKRLKAGDEVKLPDGRNLKVKPEEATDARAVLLPEEGPPMPIFAQRDGDGWKVDARPLIAGRKAAAAARRAEEAKKAAEPKKDAEPKTKDAN